MTAANRRIIALYEDNDLTPEEIAQESGYALSAVKATLMSFSQKYYKLMKQEAKRSVVETNGADESTKVEPLVTEQEFDQIRAAMINIALYPGDNVSATTQLRALQYLVDDKKGRLDKRASNIRNTKINVMLINNELKNIRAMKEQILESHSEVVS